LGEKPRLLITAFAQSEAVQDENCLSYKRTGLRSRRRDSSLLTDEIIFEKNPAQEGAHMTTKIRHIAIHTENHARMATFYKSVFGMRKITEGMTDEHGNYNKERGHLSDGVIGLALLQRQPGFSAGLDHFGLEVEDVQGVRERLKRSYPDIFIAQSQSHVPFAGLRTHDPDGNQFDLSQKGMANVREGYLQEGWDQPRWINHIAIRSARPAHIAEYYQKIFDLRPVEALSGDNAYYLTDGKVTLAVRPWDMMSYRGLWAGLDHIGFKVEDLEATKKDLDNLCNTAPTSAARKIAIGRDGETRQKNLEACKLCRYALADPDGVLLDLTK
jgi:catechol 2,3-dioxygenase-like lactoylglutathione lyase family enzyme